MTPVTQTRTGATGNCFAACLASLLDKPMYLMPEFGDDDVFLWNVQNYLAQFGLYYVQIKPDPVEMEKVFATGPVLHIIEGTSPRGGQHAIVGCNGEMVHDPHPQDGTGRGLVSVDCWGLLCNRM